MRSFNPGSVTADRNFRECIAKPTQKIPGGSPVILRREGSQPTTTLIG